MKIPTAEIIRTNKAERFLEEMNVSVEARNMPKAPYLVAANHPTIHDSILWRSLVPKFTGDVFHVVHPSALEKTGIEKLDSFIAVHWSNMLPAYSKSREKRLRLYHLIKAAIDGGDMVVINPSGKTTSSLSVPDPSSLKLGGIFGAYNNTGISEILPAFINIDKQPTEGRLQEGSSVEIAFSESPLNLKEIAVHKDRNINSEILSNALTEEWERLRED